MGGLFSGGGGCIPWSRERKAALSGQEMEPKKSRVVEKAECAGTEELDGAREAVRAMSRVRGRLSGKAGCAEKDAQTLVFPALGGWRRVSAELKPPKTLL